LNENFLVKERLPRLEPRNVFEVPDGKCYRSFFWTRHDFWIPTSDQLRRLWGLKFTGSVCADDEACRRDFLPQVFVAGTHLMVGDDEVIIPK